MKYIFLLLTFFAGMAHSTETISLINSNGINSSGHPIILMVAEEANRIQNKYNFIVEAKPGGQYKIAANYTQESPQSRLLIIYPGFIQSANSGLFSLNDFVPVLSQGDVCWSVITPFGDERKGIDSFEQFRGKEITVGGAAFGNAAHLTSLMLGEKYGFKVRYIVYKSNFDALTQMIGGQPIDLVLERYTNYQQFKEKNPNLKVLGLNCPIRIKTAPGVRTLKEQGIDSPPVFQFIMADKSMDPAKLKELSDILEKATKNIGQDKMLEVNDMVVPSLNGKSSSSHITMRFTQIQKLLVKYAEKIEASK